MHSQYNNNIYNKPLTPLKGEKPSAPLKAGGVIPVNNTFSKGTYTDYVSETPRTVDTTGNVQ